MTPNAPNMALARGMVVTRALKQAQINMFSPNSEVNTRKKSVYGRPGCTNQHSKDTEENDESYAFTTGCSDCNTHANPFKCINT